MRSNNKIVVEKIRAHIFEAVESYDGAQTYEEARKAVYKEFSDAFNHPYEVQRTPNEQTRFERYMDNGAFNFEWQTQERRKFILSLGIAQKREYSDNEVNKFYSYLIFRQCVQLR